MQTIVLLAVFVLAMVVVSLVVEALRPAPPVPKELVWAPEIPIQYATVNGHRLRYIKAGQGPNIVLLHTLRTHLDIFQKLIPDLARRFTVYALDYPGHGYSDIPEVDYEPKLFIDAVAAFLEELDIRDATLVGISIGGTMVLLLAAQGNPRVKKVVAVNPYDYAKGRGVWRASPVATLVMGSALVPVLGDTFMRFRNRLVEKLIFEGGVADPGAIPPPLMEEMFLVGTRPGHYKAFLSLLRHAHLWDRAHEQYGAINVPVLLIYGDRDWSNANERQTTLREIPGARFETVANGGHFLSLDRPRELEQLIAEFAG